MARFGLLMLNRGVWNGVPVLNDTAYFGQMTRSSQNLNQGYGYLWWLNRSGKGLPGLPENAFWANGAGTNSITVSPDQDLVVVWRWHAGNPAEFVKRIIAAIK